MHFGPLNRSLLGSISLHSHQAGQELSSSLSAEVQQPGGDSVIGEVK